MESRPTQAVLSLVGLAAAKVIRARYSVIGGVRRSHSAHGEIGTETCK
ncbi:MAG: hypothetical protein R6U98_36935 [Pirellulaceae bacterium]